MPQKKNPDIAELVRGKSGKTIGNLVGVLTMLKGLPMTYNRDMQEDKEMLFDTTDTLKASLEIYSAMLETIKPRRKIMRDAVEGDMCNATDLADYLVRKGMPFRDAHAVVGSLVYKCLSKGKALTQLTESELKEASNLLDEDCLLVLSADECIASRKTEGGTAISAVRDQLVKAKKILNNKIGGMEVESTIGSDT
jgi:argininosuccinate lyase